MEQSMTPLFQVLDSLSFAIECVAADYTGEAKHELSMLCDKLENDLTFAIQEKIEIAIALRQARSHLVYGNKQASAQMLGEISRSLWAKVPLESTSPTSQPQRGHANAMKNMFLWLAVVPGALIAGFLSTFPIHVAVMLFKFLPDSGESILTNKNGESILHNMHVEDLERMGYALFVPAVIILAGARIAPKLRFPVATGLAILISSFVSYAPYMILTTDNVKINYGAVPLWVTALLWSASIIGALIIAYKKYTKISII
jgi:hypothetical protein